MNLSLIHIFYSLVVPMVNLSYLFDQTQQTHFSSLPYTKIQSFMIRYLSGLLCIIIPVIIYCIVDVILGQGLVLKNCSSAILMIWIYYSLGNLAAYLTTSVTVSYTHLDVYKRQVFVPLEKRVRKYVNY